MKMMDYYDEQNRKDCLELAEMYYGKDGKRVVERMMEEEGSYELVLKNLMSEIRFIENWIKENA